MERFSLILQYWYEDKTKIEGLVYYKTYKINSHETYYEHVGYPTVEKSPKDAVYFSRYVESPQLQECRETQRYIKNTKEINVTKYKTEFLPNIVITNMNGFEKYIKKQCSS